MDNSYTSIRIQLFLIIICLCEVLTYSPLCLTEEIGTDPEAVFVSLTVCPVTVQPASHPSSAHLYSTTWETFWLFLFAEVPLQAKAPPLLLFFVSNLPCRPPYNHRTIMAQQAVHTSFLNPAVSLSPSLFLHCWRMTYCSCHQGNVGVWLIERSVPACVCVCGWSFRVATHQLDSVSAAKRWLCPSLHRSFALSHLFLQRQLGVQSHTDEQTSGKKWRKDWEREWGEKWRVEVGIAWGQRARGRAMQGKEQERATECMKGGIQQQSSCGKRTSVLWNVKAI